MNEDRVIAEVENEARGHLERAFAVDVGLLDDVMSEISLGCSAASGHDHDRGVGFLQLVLFNRAINALRRAREDIVQGYAAQGLTMARSAYEDWGTICYAEKNPASAPRWLQHLIPGETQSHQAPPSFKEIWNELRVEMGNEVGDLYGLLCEFAHPRTLGFAWLVEFKDGTWHFTVGPQVDETQVLAALHHTLLVAGVLLSRVGGLQERLAGGIDEDWANRVRPLLDALSKRARENHQRLGALLGLELDDIRVEPEV